MTCFHSVNHLISMVDPMRHNLIVEHACFKGLMECAVFLCSVSENPLVAQSGYHYQHTDYLEILWNCEADCVVMYKFKKNI